MNPERVLSALKPDHFSRTAYTGKITQSETFVVIDGEGNPIQVEREVIITWDTIEKVLNMVAERANS